MAKNDELEQMRKEAQEQRPQLEEKVALLEVSKFNTQRSCNQARFQCLRKFEKEKAELMNKFKQEIAETKTKMRLFPVIFSIKYGEIIKKETSVCWVKKWGKLSLGSISNWPKRTFSNDVS